MGEPTQQGYAFGPFKIYPLDRLLFREVKRVRDLTGKDFDVLCYLVAEHGRLVRPSELINNLWPVESPCSPGNLTTNISHIRKVLDEDDPRNPTYIETIPGHGYKFIAQVHDIPSSVSRAVRSTTPLAAPDSTYPHKSFQIESHKFVPVYLGSSQMIATTNARERESQWATYTEINTGSARLCVFPFEVGVWHITDIEEFNSLTDLAIWRRQTYGAILKDEHPIIGMTSDIVQSTPHNINNCLNETIGRPGYVLSLFVLTKPIWAGNDELDTALRLLCCPKPLQAEDRPDFAREDALELELKFFKDGFRSSDIHEFGLPGINCGYASWAGLSYHEFVAGRAKLSSNIVEFELAVQALWWFCSRVSEFCLTESPSSVAPMWNDVGAIIQQQFGKLKTIGPTEPTYQRTMVEAVLATSRLPELVADTLELYNQKWSER